MGPWPGLLPDSVLKVEVPTQLTSGRETGKRLCSPPFLFCAFLDLTASLKASPRAGFSSVTPSPGNISERLPSSPTPQRGPLDVFLEREGCVSIAGCSSGSYLDCFRPRLCLVNKNYLLMVFLSPASSTPRWFFLHVELLVVLMNSFTFLKLMTLELQELRFTQFETCQHCAEFRVIRGR